ncbi:DUF1304 family protein [Arthrobacter sp. Sa2CUA1]|uniref:DUF1304 family protein n=1 Tax=Arthrobacter gallicola TaxID=2762225 RepID=A0ABR8UTX2_9MICC|nr:DUF1304 family protein [Arthrobacter gallicola]MBD7995835.1 DUF1304 family protein [Arthrobacter gallicola]
MNALAQLLTGLMALVLATMWVLETFFNGSQKLYPIFRTDPGNVAAVRMWAVNVGFVNLCFAGGLASGLLLVTFGNAAVGSGILAFCLISQVVLGAVLFGSNRSLWRGALGQSLVPLAALLAWAAFG